jgi:hypothetical protein
MIKTARRRVSSKLKSLRAGFRGELARLPFESTLVLENWHLFIILLQKITCACDSGVS